MKHSTEAEDLWADPPFHEAPSSPFDSYFEAVFFMALIYVLRGLPECTEYYRECDEGDH